MTDNRLCSLVPPHYYPLTRFDDVLAPRARLRQAIVPPALLEMSNDVQDQIAKGKQRLKSDPSDAQTDGRGKDALAHAFLAARGRATVQGQVRSSDGIGGGHAGDIKGGGPP